MAVTVKVVGTRRAVDTMHETRRAVDRALDSDLKAATEFLARNTRDAFDAATNRRTGTLVSSIAPRFREGVGEVVSKDRGAFYWQFIEEGKKGYTPRRPGARTAAAYEKRVEDYVDRRIRSVTG